MASFGHLNRYATAFRDAFEPKLASYLATKVDQLATIDPLGATVAEVVARFTVQGGKRLRPMLVSIGFEASGGLDRERVMQPALAVELLHSFFLIHDDIMDRSPLRRNQPTVHEVFRREYAGAIAAKSNDDATHFVHSMALLAGDLCCAIGYEALSTSQFPADRVVAATNVIHEMVDATTVGQVLDIVVPLSGPATAASIEQIHLLKTAKYSVEGPLAMGAILGGAPSQIVGLLRAFGRSVGKAFQIQDDILGLFGSEEEVGKPTSSDVEEGKQTLLTVLAFDRGTEVQRERLQALLGKRGISAAELEEVRSIVCATGALEYSVSRAKDLVSEAKERIVDAPLPPEINRVLLDLSNFVVERVS